MVIWFVVYSLSMLKLLKLPPRFSSLTSDLRGLLNRSLLFQVHKNQNVSRFLEWPLTDKKNMPKCTLFGCYVYTFRGGKRDRKLSTPSTWQKMMSSLWRNLLWADRVKCTYYTELTVFACNCASKTVVIDRLPSDLRQSSSYLLKQLQRNSWSKRIVLRETCRISEINF